MSPGRTQSTGEEPSPCGALKEMRLLVPPRARPSLGLLLLTLLLGAVCGVPVEDPQSPEAQPGNPLRKVQGDTGMGEQQSPDPGDSVTNVSSDVNPCEKWVGCNSDFYNKYSKFLQNKLPSCPCTYPAEALDGVVRLFDQRLGRTFSWKDIKDTEELNDGRHPSAGLCLRSSWPENSRTLASQLCCYDARGRLLTRGKGAGFPELISPDYSPNLHFMVDHTPWEFCKGDWNVFHTLLPPDNGLSCPQHPSNGKVESEQLKLAKN